MAEFILILIALCYARRAVRWYRENSTGGSLFKPYRGYGAPNGH